jgi:serine/threonine-protein kinase
VSGQRKITLGVELGRGPSAVVHRAILESESFVRRAFAAKVYDLSASDEPDSALVALGRAAQRGAYVVHPNAVQIHEMLLSGRSRAIVLTELVEGTTLARLFSALAGAGRRLPLDLALFITTEIADALSGARHATTPEGLSAGMAHLDVSAHQVLLSQHGEVKLSDFGLSQVSRWGSSVRSVQGVAGRAATMAPELARGNPGDMRSDVFSLGLLLREMLVGPRFGSDVPEPLVLQHVRDGHVPPTFTEMQLHPEVRAILARATEVDPARRFPHATAMAYELRRVALPLGVGDGRLFLRSLLAELGAPEIEAVDPDTDEHEVLSSEETTREIPGDRESGLILKAASARGAAARKAERGE